MRDDRFPDVELRPDQTAALLNALKAGEINMIHFSGLYYGAGKGDLSQVTPEQVERFHELWAKVRYDEGGIVPLNRALKIRLLNAVRLGRINLHRDFAELAKAFRSAKSDWSAITREEQHFIGTFVRSVNRY